MRKTIIRIVFAIVLVSITVWIISGIFRYRLSVSPKEKLKTEKEKIATETRVQTERSIADLAKRSNAIMDWRNVFDTNEITAYTIEVQDALIRADNRPIMFLAPVEDIIRETNKYSVHFHNSLEFFPEIYFVVDCTPEQIRQIMTHRADPYDNYAVVAQISEVKKVKFEVKGYAETYEEVRLELEQPDVFIATGRCLYLLSVGNYEP